MIVQGIVLIFRSTVSTFVRLCLSAPSKPQCNEDPNIFLASYSSKSAVVTYSQASLIGSYVRNAASVVSEKHEWSTNAGAWEVRDFLGLLHLLQITLTVQILYCTDQ